TDPTKNISHSGTNKGVISSGGKVKVAQVISGDGVTAVQTRGDDSVVSIAGGDSVITNRQLNTHVNQQPEVTDNVGDKSTERTILNAKINESKGTNESSEKKKHDGTRKFEFDPETTVELSDLGLNGVNSGQVKFPKGGSIKYSFGSELKIKGEGVVATNIIARDGFSVKDPTKKKSRGGTNKGVMSFGGKVNVAQVISGDGVTAVQTSGNNSVVSITGGDSVITNRQSTVGEGNNISGRDAHWDKLAERLIKEAQQGKNTAAKRPGLDKLTVAAKRESGNSGGIVVEEGENKEVCAVISGKGNTVVINGKKQPDKGGR
ncbi:MAG: hypothetical protein PHD60_09820, partial [Clostridia bacterium]|nr:hypothetical protein [Clostridia bacterium]